MSHADNRLDFPQEPDKIGCHLAGILKWPTSRNTTNTTLWAWQIWSSTRRSPAELCEEAIRKIERLNPRIRAVITPMNDLAPSTVQKPLPDGPFSGVPFLLKDTLDEFAGVPLTMGSKACKNYFPKQDSEMVRRFKRAGLVILGKTNVPEFGLSGVTEPEAFGPTRNPWNLDHSPGGSSGGSAAAVASGMVPMASGNDGGGSIRIPASCCGLFGLKPSRGRTPLDPEMEEMWQGAVVCHVLTRTVRDSAAMLDACQGAAAGSTHCQPPPGRPYPRSPAFCLPAPLRKG